MALLEHRFGSGEPFTIGVEEEVFLVDPVSGRQVNSGAAVLQRVRVDGELGEISGELHACQVELITPVSTTARQAAGTIARLREEVSRTGAGILAAGTHPAAVEGEADITDKERYERIRFLLGDAAATPISGLHVHVGMPDPRTAVRVFNALRRDLALLQALAANSPFRHGRDTGLASAREVTLRGWPRSGAPRAVRDYEDFSAMVDRLTRAAGVPDYTWFWWKLRPHPRLGTVEVRSLDAQTLPSETAAIVALVHCLARDAAQPAGAQEPDPPPELLEEGIFRAARFGLDGELPDAEGRLTPARELLAAALVRARRWAAELDCESELDAIADLAGIGGGAGRQRTTYEVAGIDAVVRELTRLTMGEKWARA